MISSLTAPPQGFKTLSALCLSTTEVVCECQTGFYIRAALMFVLPGYDAFLGFLLIAAAVPVLALVTNKLLAPRSQAGERELTYESGMEPIGGAWIQFNIRYYMFALVFVIFDVETVFLYPWAVAFHRLGILAFIEALVFITILLVALAYAWRKGALEWS
jgi:NAD(P)H-quinone oxidoreductase subunit 3